MRIRARYWGLGTLLALGAALMLLAALPSSANGGKGHGKHGAKSGAMHVRWDITRLVGGAPPGPLEPGGSAIATAPNGAMITLTGTGTFVAPAGSNGGSGAVTGGGTWRMSTGASGTYVAEELVSFAFDSFQISPPVFIDHIGALNERANGTAVLRISFSNGQSGVLTVGCHGPGATVPIFEGVAVTMGAETFYTVSTPAGEVGRTIFHVRR
jgi:hypothetical protein